MENKKILTLFNTKQFIFFLLGIAAAVIFFVMTPFEGLSVEGMKVLGSSCWQYSGGWAPSSPTTSPPSG